MGAWACADCGTKYGLRIFTCPRCQGTELEEEIRLPKITRHGGASVEGVPATNKEEVTSSPGMDSSPSSEKDVTRSETMQSSLGSPAPTTESHSAKGRAVRASTARSTDGSRSTARAERK